MKTISKFLFFAILLFFNSAFADLASDAEKLFNWGEQKYPAYFATGKTEIVTQVLDYQGYKWYYRFYPQTQIYLITNKLNKVYVLGGVFGSKLLYIGKVEDLIDASSSGSSAQNIKLNFYSKYLSTDEVSTIKISSDGAKAYITDDSADLKIIDISKPNATKLLGSYPNAKGISIDLSPSGNVAYVVTHGKGLLILDVSDNSNPTLISTYGTDYKYKEIKISKNGTKAYVSTYDAGKLGGFEILDISNPNNIQILGNYSQRDAYYLGLSIDQTKIYLSTHGNGLQIIDVSDVTNPTLLGSYLTPLDGMGMRDGFNGAVPSPDGTKVYASVYPSMGNQDADNYMAVIDVSNPATPTLLGSYKHEPNNTYTSDTIISKDGTKLFLTASHRVDPNSNIYTYDGVIEVVDISVATDPTFVSSYNLGRNTSPSSLDISKDGITLIGGINGTTTVNRRLEVIKLSLPLN
jgi:hypothetical protein